MVPFTGECERCRKVKPNIRWSAGSEFDVGGLWPQLGYATMGICRDCWNPPPPSPDTIAQKAATHQAWLARPIKPYPTSCEATGCEGPVASTKPRCHDLRRRYCPEHALLIVALGLDVPRSRSR